MIPRRTFIAKSAVFGGVGMLCLSSCTSLKQDPWTALFNGKDMDGWEIRDGSAEVRVEKGVLVARQTDSVNFAYLVHKGVFSDFILECDAKLTGSLNSGILIRGVSDPGLHNGRLHGFQMEIDQTERRWTGGIYEEAGRKWLTPIKGMGAGEEEALNAYTVADWNHYRIEAISDTFKSWVNGVPTTHLIDSKTDRGVIGFQIHRLLPGKEAGVLSIKNVRIIAEHPGKYSKEMSVPAKRTE